MTRRRLFISLCALAWLSVNTAAGADKVPDLGRTKFKEIAKYLNLTAEQQQKIKPDVDRIQDVVKQAEKQRGGPGFGGGGRTPIGSGNWGGGPARTGGGAVQVGDIEGRRLQRQEWQKEITNRAEEIKTFLTPPQIEKFKAMGVPDLMAGPDGRRQ